MRMQSISSTQIVVQYTHRNEISKFGSIGEANSGNAFHCSSLHIAFLRLQNAERNEKEKGEWGEERETIVQLS